MIYILEEPYDETDYYSRYVPSQVFEVEDGIDVEQQYKDYIQTLAKEGYNLVVNPHWLNVMDYELHNSHLTKSDYNRNKKAWNKLLKVYNISNFILEELGGKELEFKTIV